MFQKIFCFFFLALFLSEIHGHTYHSGRCPVIEPITDFNITGMLGMWYVVQKTSTRSICITYNITQLEEPYHYCLEEVGQHSTLGLSLLKYEYHSSGELSIPDPSVPGKMNVKFSLNVIGEASFTVFMTDYDNYAGIFTCQGLVIGHRQSASILSRTPTLDQVYIDKLRTRLSSYNIDPFDLSRISQVGCPKNKNEPEGVNIDIDDEIGLTIGGVTEDIFESTNSDLLQEGNTENGQIVDLDVRSKQKENNEWLPCRKS